MRLEVKKKLKEEVSAEVIIDELLDLRGIKEKEIFLNPPSPLEIDFEDFGFEKELKKTIDILRAIKKSGKKVVVYTDYDADGITGGAILWETLYLLGFDVMPYVPHRQKEGYGFSVEGLKRVKELYNPALIISVDHGISAADKIAFAKRELGIPIIVTDHHLKPEILPQDAEAIFHTEKLSGSGVSYFFSKALFNALKDKKTPDELEENFSNYYLSLASIGTIADLVPLVGPSRSIAKHGLDAFGKITRVGIRELLKEAGIEGKKITPWEIGFIIAPRINAVGRLEDATDALRLLCTRKKFRARELARKLGEKNRIRQNMVEEAVELARRKVERNYGKKLPKVLIVWDEAWHEGIIGLIASKLVEEFNRPAIVITSSDGFYKASARSIPSFHITDFLRSLKEFLLEVGGHSQAAGFKMQSSKLKGFIDKAVLKAEKLLKEEDLQKTLTVDLQIPLSSASLKLAFLLENLQPFGIGNPAPVFLSEAEVVSAKFFGKNNDHLKIHLKDEKTKEPFEVIAFGEAGLFFKLSRGKRVRVVYSIEINRWRGREFLRGRLKYIEDKK